MHTSFHASFSSFHAEYSDAQPELIGLFALLPASLVDLERMKERAASSKHAKHDESNGELSQSPASKWLIPNTPWEKEELYDVLHWIRQAIGLICGVVWGCIPLEGSFWIVLFVVLSSCIVYGYYTLVLKIDEEDFGGHGSLLQEGMFTSVMLFLLCWILVYSLLHF